MCHTLATTYLFAYFIVLKAIALGSDISGSNSRDIVDKIVSSLLCSVLQSISTTEIVGFTLNS